MSTLPTTITLDQINAALDALGLSEHRGNIVSLDIDPQEVTVLAYARNAFGKTYEVAPGAMATKLARIPIA